MAYKYSFFNSAEGTQDRLYSASDISDRFAAFFSNGVIPDSTNSLGNALLVEQYGTWGNMQVSVAPGKAVINGYLIEVTETEIIDIEEYFGAGNRYDYLVLELNLSPGERKISIKQIQGSYNPLQTLPELVRTSTIYQIALAWLDVKGVIMGIEDTRSDTNVCGISKVTTDMWPNNSVTLAKLAAEAKEHKIITLEYGLTQLSAELQALGFVRNTSTGIITWTVPVSRYYKIICTGAGSYGNDISNAGRAGGSGGTCIKTCHFNAGDVITIRIANCVDYVNSSNNTTVSGPSVNMIAVSGNAYESTRYSSGGEINLANGLGQKYVFSINNQNQLFVDIKGAASYWGSNETQTPLMLIPKNYGCGGNLEITFYNDGDKSVKLSSGANGVCVIEW